MTSYEVEYLEVGLREKREKIQNKILIAIALLAILFFVLASWGDTQSGVYPSPAIEQSK